jgi:hypothetical protein
MLRCFCLGCCKRRVNRAHISYWQCVGFFCTSSRKRVTVTQRTRKRASAGVCARILAGVYKGVCVGWVESRERARGSARFESRERPFIVAVLMRKGHKMRWQGGKAERRSKGAARRGAHKKKRQRRWGRAGGWRRTCAHARAGCACHSAAAYATRTHTFAAAGARACAHTNKKNITPLSARRAPPSSLSCPLPPPPRKSKRPLPPPPLLPSRICARARNTLSLSLSLSTRAHSL